MDSSNPSSNIQEYRDFALVQDTSALGGQEKRDQNFPVRLHYMLSEMEKDGLEHIVSWQPHGRCFVVHDQKEFVKSVLPMWFRQTKFPSFQRQLNIYGFTRIGSGPDKGAYYHECFLRGKQFLAQRIDRVKGGQRKQSGSKQEPNFYRMRPLPSANAKSDHAPRHGQSPSLAAVDNSKNALRLNLQDLSRGHVLQNMLRASQPLPNDSVLAPGLIEAVLARRQYETNPVPAPQPSSRDLFLETLLKKETAKKQLPSGLPSGLQALAAASDSTVALDHALDLQRRQHQHLRTSGVSDYLLASILGGNTQRNPFP